MFNSWASNSDYTLIKSTWYLSCLTNPCSNLEQQELEGFVNENLHILIIHSCSKAVTHIRPNLLGPNLFYFKQLHCFPEK